MIQERKECYFCKTTKGLHLHHIFFGTANRRKSTEHGMTCYLCGEHHNLSGNSVHSNRDMDMVLKKKAQAIFEERIGTREYFIKEFGRSYL